MRPLLAATVEDLYKLRYPLLASPKLDGIRALVLDRSVYSRSGKRLPNEQVQMLFGRAEFDWLDGELILGPPTDSDVYHRTGTDLASASKIRASCADTTKARRCCAKDTCRER